MEKIFELLPDRDRWQVNVREKLFGHSSHTFCQVCGSKMKFSLNEKTPKFSGYTRNVMYDVTEICPNGCEEFVMQTVYRNAIDGMLYVNNFVEIEEYKEHLLEKEPKEKKWTKS